MSESIPSFTNQPGTYFQYKTVRERTVDNLSGNVDLSDSSVKSAISQKPYPVHGDHRKALDYWRNVGIVDFDNQYANRYRLYGGDQLFQDRTSYRSIALEHGPFNYDPRDAEILSNTENGSIVKALNARSANAGIGVDLIEAAETFEMFAVTVKRAIDFLKAVKRLDPVAAAKALGYSKRGHHGKVHHLRPDHLYLEYVYGWKPLVADLMDTQTIVKDLINRVRTFRGTGTYHQEYDGKFPYGLNNWQYSCRCSARSVFIAELAHPWRHVINQLGLVNGLDIAWEIVPFSFVVDWFLPVGQILNACTSGFGLTDLGGFTSSKHSYKLRADSNPHAFPDYDPLVAAGSYSERGIAFRRTAYAESPLTRLFSNPHPWSTPHVLNAISLLGTMLF